MNGENKNRTVTMAHGAGGRQTSELIENIFASHFANPDLTQDDAAVLNGRLHSVSCVLSGRKYREAVNLRNSKRSRLHGSEAFVFDLCVCD